MDDKLYYYGTGRRKEAVARVKLFLGGGAIIVNGTPYEKRFPRITDQRIITQPLTVTDSIEKYSAVIKVEGGGISGQGGAICHGIARALVKANESLKPILRQSGMLTRDSRVKERKKPGLKRARKAPQYTKR
ncbi:30S ribosomal protein S9 [Chloroflexota bacterium]